MGTGFSRFFALQKKPENPCITCNAETLRPELQLPLTFLAGHVQHPAADAQTAANLQQERGFANARGAAH